MNDSVVVEKYYNENAESEWNRFKRHPIEFEITKRLIEKYIPKLPAKVIDIGGGPGRYSLWLSSKGYEVTLFDLAKANVEYATNEAKKQNINISKYIVGDALELDSYVKDMTYDVVLLMGPLYHLISEADRVTVVEKALSVLNDNGIIIASFISGYAPIIDVLKNYPEELNGKVEQYVNYLENGANVVSEHNPGFTNAYFMNPRSIDPFMSKFSLTKLGLFTAESILGPYENHIKKADTRTFDTCIDLAMKFIDDERCRACGEHLVYIGSKIS